jgi:molybdopterin synthase catalytic subunit
MPDIRLVVTAEDFDPGAEIGRLSGAGDCGAVTSFVGIVRGGEGKIAAMTLEHYPGMTEKQISRVIDLSLQRWDLARVTVIHRVGRLLPGAHIVFVGVAAPHRAAAFSACEFLIDWLKTKAPFWKLEETPDGERWVAAQAADISRANRWDC